MRVVVGISKAIVIFYLASSLIPILRLNHWTIRIWDFPRLQLLILGFAGALILTFLPGIRTKTKILFGLSFLLGAGFDAYRILPYSSLWKKETLAAKQMTNERELKILTVNVLQKNDEYGKLIDLIESKDPDIILLVEVNDEWIKNLSPLEEKYRVKLAKPQENTYGIAFYSKLEAEVKEIRFLIEEDVPSVFARLKLPTGELFEVHGLHPKPPQIETETTTNRDAELIVVAKKASKSSLPTIVLGDLNDVAWSHTTRLFRRISNLLDPRVGRGTYSTFPAGIPFFHFPLDYIFSSDEWRLGELETLPSIGSDHYPVFISLFYDESAQKEQEAPPKEEGDTEEARKTIKKAK